jgi:hypothetical protein
VPRAEMTGKPCGRSDRHAGTLVSSSPGRARCRRLTGRCRPASGSYPKQRVLITAPPGALRSLLSNVPVAT